MIFILKLKLKSMAKLILKRSNEFMNSFRPYKVYLNSKLFEISNNEQKVMEIEQGSHNIKVKIDWCGSKNYNFVVSFDDEIINLEIRNYISSKFAMVFTSICLLLIFLPTSILQPINWAFITASGLILLISYITVLRNKYLIIRYGI